MFDKAKKQEKQENSSDIPQKTAQINKNFLNIVQQRDFFAWSVDGHQQNKLIADYIYS